jgi:alpha-glucoside transport system substrate-binding protein
MSKRLIALLLSVALVAAMTSTACQPQQDDGTQQEGDIGTVSVIGVWGGGEIEPFEEVVAGWEDETGGNMEFEGTRDLSSILRARVSGGNPPDVAILPNPALLQEFAQRGDLQPLDEMLDMNQLQQDYSETWIEQATVNGQLYGLFVKAATKSTVWYNPNTFEENNYEIPNTWDELLQLSQQMAQDGTPPWSIGVESGAASGWPASDWVQELILAEAGPDVYDQWVDHEIPWTDDAIRAGFERFGEVVHNDDFVSGGTDQIVSTSFQDAAYAPYQDPPRAQMYFLGAFAQGFIEEQFDDLQPVEDYDFFDFPPVDQQFQNAATGGADVLVVFNDNASTRSFVEYLSQGQNWESWAQAGGYTTPNQGLDPETYPDELSRKAAEQLTESEIFRFDADDAMPAEVQNAFWEGLLEYIQNPNQLDQILQNIENVAEEAYAQLEQEQGAPAEEETPGAGQEETPGAGQEETPTQ